MLTNRHHTRHSPAVAAGLLLFLVAGCGAKDSRPKYSPPKLAASEVAVLKADSGYWIGEVDGARIAEPGMSMLGQPGNTVKVAPGERTIVVTKSGNSSLVQVGGPSRNFKKFSYPFQAGQTYKIGAGGSFGRGIKVTNTRTGTDTIIDG